jgi:hypothetical protein
VGRACRGPSPGERSRSELLDTKALYDALIRPSLILAALASYQLLISAIRKGSASGASLRACRARAAGTREQADLIELAAERSGSAVELISAYVTRARDNLIKSNYTEGCTIAPLVLEGARESDLLANAGSAAFSLIIESLAFQFAFFGMGRASARELAEVVVSGVEGALVTARAFRSPAPFDSILAALVNHATQLGLAEPTSTPGLAQVRPQTPSRQTQ